MEPFARDIVPLRIEDEMRSSYMDYSMSVIIGRALPDVRDGLKPVHRRILYAMYREGLTANKKYSKCAGVVGEVLKRYHPHGDQAVYDALVRMAQPWNLRYLLVDGQGNFGSVDGDPAAAYRYTECRMTRLAEEMLTDIDKETVDYIINFDGTTYEPDVLPSRLPNLLVNGADGIAVGMATKIPPHNLGETIDACMALIDDPSLDPEALLRIMPGPDFPTGGTIYGRRGVRDAYLTGRGRVVVRGTADIEDISGGRQSIVINEIPFQVNKARLLEQIADLVKERKIEGISALRDESDRHGMRIVVELKRDAFAEVVLNHLYKHTALQSTFGVNLLAIVGKQPRILTLKELLQLYISHRRDVILRRTRYELRKARERAHILEGFRKALDHLDEVIALIRAAPNPAAAREALVERLDLTVVQADAILEMRLQRLTGMERQKILDEYEAVLQRIAILEEILGSEERLMGVVRDELQQIRDLYADERRTQIIEARGELTMHDLVAEEDQVVTMSRLGYIKRCSPSEWRMQRRGGMGKAGMETREEDFVTSLFIANTHSLLLVFTDQGRVFPLQVYEVPQAGRNARGRPIVNLVPVPEGEKVAAVVSVKDLEEEGELFFVSRQGLVKRTAVNLFRNLRQGGMNAVRVAEGDELVVVRRVDYDPCDAMLLTRDGKCIRFGLDDVPQVGRGARGNRGIRLASGDIVVDALLVPKAEEAISDEEAEAEEVEAPEEEASAEDAELAPEEEPWDTTLLTVTQLGFGKRTPFQQYRSQGRYGKGILSIKVSPQTGGVVAAREVASDDQLMVVTNTGRIIRIAALEIRLVMTRSSRGVRLMRLERGEQIVDVARLAETGEMEEPETSTEPEGENE